jgi:predicted nucleic acid-binding Zn ribbon protein
MARRVATRDPDDDDDFDDYESESYEEEDIGEDSDEPTKECPYCQEEIHEDAVRCPHCEKYLSDEDRPASSKGWLIIVGTILCLLITLNWLLG